MIKEEEVEDVDGSYACVICYESVRGMAALCCARCSSNPFHASCVDGTGFAEMCPQCAGKTVVAWTGRDAGSAAAAAAAIVIEDAPRDPAPAATPPKERSFWLTTLAYNLELVDEKTRRRLIKNRASAERSRMQRIAKMEELELRCERQEQEIQRLRAQLESVSKHLN